MTSRREVRVKHLRPRLAKKARRPGPPRAGRHRFLPRPARNRDGSAPAFVASEEQGHPWPFLAVVLCAFGAYLALFWLMNGCIPFFCG